MFSVPELISELSGVCPLLPGDIIFTGTPAGVGNARDPKRFIPPGAVLTSHIEGIGELRNESWRARVTRTQKAATDVALHRLTRITIGIPNVEETAGYYGARPAGAAGLPASHIVAGQRHR